MLSSLCTFPNAHEVIKIKIKFQYKSKYVNYSLWKNGYDLAFTNFDSSTITWNFYFDYYQSCYIIDRS